MNAPHWLYRGWVHHARYGAINNRFRYPALFLCLPMHETLQTPAKLFSHNRFNLLSFYDADHGCGDGHAQAWVRGILQAHGLAAVTTGTLWLQTQPRIFGFVFNPVSFWYCHDEAEQLRAVLCEVNNTFGERHVYLLTAPNQGVINAQTALQCDKVFHVSPFLPVRGSYRFRFRQEGARRTVRIDFYDDRDDRQPSEQGGQRAQLRLTTAISGVAGPVDDAHLLRALAAHGWSTLLVVARIHWQALRLWRQGAPFYRKPAPPAQETTT